MPAHHKQSKVLRKLQDVKSFPKVMPRRRIKSTTSYEERVVDVVAQKESLYVWRVEFATLVVSTIVVRWEACWA